MIARRDGLLNRQIRSFGEIKVGVSAEATMVRIAAPATVVAWLKTAKPDCLRLSWTLQLDLFSLPFLRPRYVND